MARRRDRVGAALATAAGAVLVFGVVFAPGVLAIEVEEPGAVATMPPPTDHLVWVPDRLFQHSILYDGDRGTVLGMIDTGAMLTPMPPLWSRTRGEIYSVDTTYTRGKRGDRLDYVTIYEAETTNPIGEIPLPTKTAESNTSLQYSVLLDGERFLAVFNQFPSVSVSIVDATERRFVEEILVSGCAGIYPVAPRQFGTLCGDGTVLRIDLDETGRKLSLVRSEPFFDAVADPISMSGGRSGSRWVFVSFEGMVHEVEFAGEKPAAREAWSMLDDADRSQEWRVGGLQHVALHPGTQRLFSVMHQGGPGSHKEAGPEIWVFDMAEKRRVARYESPNLAVAFLLPLMDIETDGWVAWALDLLVPSEGVHTIAVTQDASPLLFARNAELGVVAVLDATTGEHLRNLTEAGLAGPTLGVP